MSKQLHKKSQKKTGKMTPDEVRIANRVLAGKEKIYKFKNAEDAIASLRKSSAS